MSGSESAARLIEIGAIALDVGIEVRRLGNGPVAAGEFAEEKVLALISVGTGVVGWPW